MSERIIKVARLPQSCKPVPIWDGKTLEPIEVQWLAVSHVPESDEGPETYVVYFLDSSAKITECLQFDTLEIALDQACDIMGMKMDSWKSLDHEVTTGVPIPLSLLP